MPVKVAILWHMHQPNYQEPHSRRMVLPWVRLHAIKDYLDMPLLAARHDRLKVTFNLVPALLDQLQLYVDGGSDRHLDLSRRPAEQLDDDSRREILGSFFEGNPASMIEPYARYTELYRKYRENAGDAILADLFTSEELRDLQVWSNLAWVDPMFRDDPAIRPLLAKGRYFSEEEKQRMLDWQIDLMGRVVTTYADLFAQSKIDISFTPYYHPILPLLCDTDSAREAMPSIALPGKPFRHPEDAEHQIAMSQEKYRELFGQDMIGMWPSEGSVSEEVADICRRRGLQWIATDEEILYGSLRKSDSPRAENPTYTVYDYHGLRLFFRDHSLSDRIGFVYSSWDADRAAADFIAQLKDIGRLHQGRVEDLVVPVILDGENAWEYYANDGHEFLNLVYEGLAGDPDIITVSMTEAAQSRSPRPLPRLFAGSWINHNFRIWIGHHEDNAAWDLLSSARDTLAQFQKEHPDFDADRLAAAWRQIYIAEGSDWCWWYGDEHRGSHNEIFDRIFRRHLIAVYELLDLGVPASLYVPIHQGETKSLTVLPEAVLTPVLDGRVTHFYEWAGAGFYDCTEAGGAMHRAQQHLCCIYFVYDHDLFYIRLDFENKKAVESIREPNLLFTFYTPEARTINVPMRAGKKEFDPGGMFRYAFDDVMEIAFPRDRLLTNGFGQLAFGVALRDGREKLESWPDGKPISLEVYERNRELFWP